MLSIALQNALKHFRHYELVVIADKLSGNSSKWKFSKRSIGTIVKAISENVSDDALVAALEELWGTRVHCRVFHEDIDFPLAHQFGKTIIGPLGVFTTPTHRTKYDALQTVGALSYVKDLGVLVESLKDVIPSDVYSKVHQKGSRARYMQAVLAYADDSIICEKTNELVIKGKLKIEVPHLFEMEDEYSKLIATRYGLIERETEDPVDNLKNLLSSKLTEKQLAPELKYYKGDYSTKLLEYCIKHDPLEILTSLFGLPVLREITWQWKLNTESSRDLTEVATLVLLKLGLNIPPELEGIDAYAKRVKQYEAEFMAVSDTKTRSGVMSRLYIEIERFLKDLVNFQVGFLWQEEISEFSEKDKIREILLKKVLKPIKKEKPVDRLTFGDLIHILRYLKTIAKKNRKLNSKVKKTFERPGILPDKSMSILDTISPYRTCFAHPEAYPGSDVCTQVFSLAIELGEILKRDGLYPTALRITRQIDDDYGRRYAEGIDENNHPWTIYTKRWLMPQKPYLMYSRTNPVAIDPILVQKI